MCAVEKGTNKRHKRMIPRAIPILFSVLNTQKLETLKGMLPNWFDTPIPAAKMKQTGKFTLHQ